jgi:UDP-glucose 4-epimerase
MKILVTGGAGFIGSNIVDAYLKAGHEVAILDSLITGLRENLNPAARFFEADVRDVDAVKRAIDEFQPEVLNHHAAHLSVSKSVADPRFDAEVNIIGFLTVVEAARPYLKRVIVASSGGVVYGDAQQIPTPESHSTQPISPYGVAKLTMEHYLHYYQLQYGLEWVALRYPNVYGPRQNPKGETGVIAVYLNIIGSGGQPQILGDGLQTRDFVFIEDVVRASIQALDHGQGPYNIGTGIETKVVDLFHQLQNAYGSSLPEVFGPARPGEQRRSALDNTKAQVELDWRPQVHLTEGLQKTVAWYRQANTQVNI